MICLKDNDFILKFAAWDLIEPALVVLNATLDEVRVLPTAPYKIKNDRGGRLAQKYGSDGVARALEFIDSVSKIDEVPDTNELDTLLRVENIDDEGILFASTCGLTDFLVATSDKRSLIALADAPGCEVTRSRMHGKVICLEQAILRIVSHEAFGFEFVRDHIVPMRDCDIAVKAAFGSGALALEPTVVASLINRVRDLRELTGLLLVDETQ